MKIFVIGAGVSALAFCSFFKNDNINVIEKNSYAGRKLLATGNGRCNFTNLNLSLDKFYSSDKNFVKYSLDNFDNKDLINYFEKIGIESVKLESGRVYPKTMSAKTIRNSLILEAKDNTNFIFDTEVTDIDFTKKIIHTEKSKYKYDILIIATGGKTLKNSGSDGKILDILKKYTKTIETLPGITNFETTNPLAKNCKGTKVKAKASLIVDDKNVIHSIDDVIFQDYGLTGTAILDISNECSLNLSKNRLVYISIDFYPEYSYNTLLGKLKEKLKRYPNRIIEEILLGVLHENLIEEIIIRSGAKIIKDKYIAIEKIAYFLKNMKFKVKKVHDKENAQVTLGGVDIKTIDQKTMKSLDLKDTYFIGEIIDVAGACGGYNIQWAFSSAKCVSDDIRRLYAKNKQKIKRIKT